MKKLRNKTIKIYIHLFEHTVYVIFTKNPYYYRNTILYNKHKSLGKYEKNFVAIHTWSEGMGKCWCILPNESEVHLVIHEVNHAVDAIIEMYGLEGTEI